MFLFGKYCSVRDQLCGVYLSDLAAGMALAKTQLYTSSAMLW
ncbi:hypothetical protein CPter291_1823 [Collimonas pratensis]|uniref:Uncharacterized protein n=1 Tax=Collimonas pratensis TaxID=279113 RepID=A0ABM5Z4Z6_9BURK|nr:hypothetical protein CPter291_1823 [Collimonas pratensis]